MTIDESGVVQSVRARLLTVAASSRADPNAILTRCGIERFSREPGRLSQWNAFLRRIRLSPDDHDFGSEAAKVRAFVGPALETARLSASGTRSWLYSWPPGGPWIPADPATGAEGRP